MVRFQIVIYHVSHHFSDTSYILRNHFPCLARYFIQLLEWLSIFARQLMHVLKSLYLAFYHFFSVIEAISCLKLTKILSRTHYYCYICFLIKSTRRFINMYKLIFSQNALWWKEVLKALSVWNKFCMVLM